jgi:protein-tyrosine phosphatase
MTVALSRLNFRDLGGLPAAGGVLRHHALFRSEGPASFLDDHHAELERLGIRLICDLRAPVEREAAPHRWPHAARTLHLDLTNDLRSEASEGWAALRNDPSEAGALRAMTLNYAAMPAALHPQLAPLADALLAGGLPVLIHCTAGKDRTGVLIALLLILLGVPREAVVADYLRSDIFAANLRLGGSIADAFVKTFGFTPSQATINAMIGVNPAFLEAAFAAIDQHWGSLADYFRSAGLTGARQAQLCAALVAPLTY